MAFHLQLIYGARVMKEITRYPLMLTWACFCFAFSCGPSQPPRSSDSQTAAALPAEEQKREGDAEPLDAKPTSLMKARIDAQIAEAVVGSRTMTYYSFHFGKSPIGSAGSQSKEGRGVSAVSEVSWRRGEITRIVRKLPGKEWQVQQTFHYCGGLLCRAEQRERIETEETKEDAQTGGSQLEDAPQRVFRAYIEGDRIGGQTAFEQQPVTPEAPPERTEHSPEPGMLKQLVEEGRSLLTETSRKSVPQVAAGDLFSDTGEAARALKKALPYAAVSGEHLVLARVMDWLSPEELAGATVTIDQAAREAVIQFDEVKKIEAFRNAEPFWFLLGKPMVIYSKEGFSRLVHIDTLFLRAPLSQVGKNTRIGDILTGPSAYIGAGLKESLKGDRAWTWGHYAGFEIPRQIENAPKAFETMDAAFEAQFDIKSRRDKFEQLYEKTYSGRSPRYDFYFRFSHVVETEYPEKSYNLDAYQVLFRTRESGKTEDWTRAFTDLFDSNAVPFEAVADTAADSTLFLFHRNGGSPALVLFRDEKLFPLVPTTDDGGFFRMR